jgi:2-dehydro-3-deoxygluconokinase
MFLPRGLHATMPGLETGDAGLARLACALFPIMPRETALPPLSAPPRTEIIAFGEPLIEFNQTGPETPRSYLQGFGGDTSNFAIAARRQGARSAVMGAIGSDTHGDMLAALWADEGVDTRLMGRDPDAPTGIYFVTHGAEGHSFSFLRKGSAASLYRPADLPATEIAQAAILHLSGITLAISDRSCEAAYAAIHAARSAGTKVSFDTNLRLRLWSVDRARAVMTDIIGLSDICLPSLDDVTAITGLTDPDAIADRCLLLGAKLVALKLGKDGALIADGRQRIRVAPVPCRPVDATGAGDTFGGAFCARLVAGDDLETAGRYAAAAAALSTEGYGAVAPIPTAAQVRAALATRKA